MAIFTDRSQEIGTPIELTDGRVIDGDYIIELLNKVPDMSGNVIEKLDEQFQKINMLQSRGAK